MEQEDSDVSQEFQNYVLSKEERPYHGVVIHRDLCETEELVEPLMRCTIPPFGWTCSPYFILIILEQAVELYIGNHTDTNNPFHWHHVHFNLPCATRYYTSLPRVWLIRFDGEVVVRVIVLFDYGYVYGLVSERVRSGLRQISAGLQYIRNKEADRKHTAGGQ